jgi:hypothetical protein
MPPGGPKDQIFTIYQYNKKDTVKNKYIMVRTYKSSSGIRSNPQAEENKTTCAYFHYSEEPTETDIKKIITNGNCFNNQKIKPEELPSPDYTIIKTYEEQENGTLVDVTLVDVPLNGGSKKKRKLSKKNKRTRRSTLSKKNKRK